MKSSFIKWHELRKGEQERRKENTCSVTGKWGQCWAGENSDITVCSKNPPFGEDKCWWWKLGMVWKNCITSIKCWSPVYQKFTHSLQGLVRDPLGGMHYAGSLRLLCWGLSCVEFQSSRDKSLNGSYSSLGFVMGNREDYGRKQTNT